MRIKHNEIEIIEDDPFANCKLERKKYATVLSGIINEYSQGFVLALNNKWGTGKTTFIKMWQQDLTIQNYQTLYFNAWENDFENNPLIALMGELKSLTNKKNEKEFKKVIKQAAVLSKNMAPILIKAIAEKYIDTKSLQEAIVGLSKGLSEVFMNEVSEYEKRKESISDFKKSLTHFVANTNNGKPIVFIIDELDRCRPNYAVSILEQIKHFFSIPNIVFILSIDKEQLGNAIKGVYGSDSIDSEEYLRRFIDLEYSIPEPEVNIFYNYLYDYFKFDDFFKSNERIRNRKFDSDKDRFLDTCKIIFSNWKLPLRLQEKIFSHARIALKSYSQSSNVRPQVFLFLIVIKIRDNSLYEKLKSKLITVEEFQEKFYEMFKNQINDETLRTLIWLETNLIQVYHKHYFNNQFNSKSLLVTDPETGKDKPTYPSRIKPEAEQISLDYFKSFYFKDNLNLFNFTKHIDLLEEIKPNTKI